MDFRSLKVNAVIQSSAKETCVDPESFFQRGSNSVLADMGRTEDPYNTKNGPSSAH